MKRHLAIFLLAFLLGWVIFFQMSEPSRSILALWRSIYTMHGQGSRLLGSFTLPQQWTVTWRCTFSSLTLQIDGSIDGRQGHALRETVPCDGNERRVPFQEPGSFYLAVMTEGEWMLQMQESPIEYEAVRPYGGTYTTSYNQCNAHKILIRNLSLKNDCHEVSLIVTVNKIAQKKNLISRKNLAIFYSISEGKGSI
ncbi:hypothetical protein [Ktedonobacter robiniae]|uniref:hypothetical protein n=1 Tax=Ktedonobacter robiniae TaxID=2778365 RepID=UPI00191558DD|nr:hypothetical protein [Ktedonobacter robiniae]